MLRVRTIFTGVPGTPWYSNQFYDLDPGDAQTAVDGVSDFWSVVDANMNQGVTWATEATVTILDPTTGQPTGVATTTPATGSGGSTVDMVPRAAQALVATKTGVFAGGRELRGKIFVPGLTVDAMDPDGSLSSGMQTIILNAAVAAFVTTPGNPTLGVYSRKNGTITDVVTIGVSGEFAVLRSRRD